MVFHNTLLSSLSTYIYKGNVDSHVYYLWTAYPSQNVLKCNTNKKKKILKYTFKKFPSLTAMCENSFVCLCSRTISSIYTIFNTTYSIVNLNNIYQFEDIQRVFTRTRAHAERQADSQTDRQTSNKSNALKILAVITSNRNEYVALFVDCPVYFLWTV